MCVCVCNVPYHKYEFSHAARARREIKTSMIRDVVTHTPGRGERRSGEGVGNGGGWEKFATAQRGIRALRVQVINIYMHPPDRCKPN